MNAFHIESSILKRSSIGLHWFLYLCVACFACHGGRRVSRLFDLLIWAFLRVSLFISKVVRLRGDLSARFVRGVAPSSGRRAGGDHGDYLPVAVALGGGPGVLLGGSRGAMGGAEVESRGSRRRGLCVCVCVGFKAFISLSFCENLLLYTRIIY